MSHNDDVQYHNPEESKLGSAIISRTSHWRCSAKKVILKNFVNFTGKHLRWSLFSIKLHAFRP